MVSFASVAAFSAEAFWVLSRWFFHRVTQKHLRAA